MDDEYNFINENGERVDQDGKVLQENTESVERQPFLRDGKPV
jgi:hypothetical protein